MELLSIGRVLSRRRIRVALGLVVAVLIGAYVGGVVPPLGGSEKGSPTGQALVRVLIDTRVPLPATTTPIGADTISKRSDLLALEMASRETTAAIARRAGIGVKELAVVGPAFAPVSLPTVVPAGQLPQLTANAAAEAVHEPYVVWLVPFSDVPTIVIGTAAPDPRRAALLAEATVAAMRRAIATRASGHAAIKVEQLGSVRSVTVPPPSSRHRLLGAVAAAVLFAAWCAAIVIASGIPRWWRRGRGSAASHVVV